MRADHRRVGRGVCMGIERAGTFAADKWIDLVIIWMMAAGRARRFWKAARWRDSIRAEYHRPATGGATIVRWPTRARD